MTLEDLKDIRCQLDHAIQGWGLMAPMTGKEWDRAYLERYFSGVCDARLGRWGIVDLARSNPDYRKVHEYLYSSGSEKGREMG